MIMKRYILTLLATITLISVSATNQTDSSNNKTSREVDELLSEDEILSTKNESKILSDSIGIDLPEFFKKLDEIYDAPILLTWFQEAYKLNGEISVRPVELTNMYTSNKNYQLLLNVEKSYGNSSRLISTEETISIIDGLKRISEYINNSFSEDSEEISYCKKFSQNFSDQISFWFEYDANDCKWDGYIGLINKTSWFDNVIRDLPQFIELLEQGVNTLEARRVNGDFSKKLLIETQKNGAKLYHWDENSQYDDLPITSVEYIGKKYVEDKNKILKDIIKENNPKIDTLGKYGYIDIVWNPYGGVVNAKLIISKDAAKQISERTIKIMLNKIREFKIKKYQTSKDEECEYMRVAIPLRMEK